MSQRRSFFLEGLYVAVRETPPIDLSVACLCACLRRFARRRQVFRTQTGRTQVGQGPLSERKSERLIRADVGFMLYRKIWQREVMALAEDKPMKKWLRSAAVIASEDE